jgi:hypothetical protein
VTSGALGVGAGHDHTCFVLGDGTVECFGRNAYGQLGDGTTTDTYLGTIARVTDARAIGSGDRENCVVLSTGAVWCWGFGAGGATPAPISGIADAVQVTAIEDDSVNSPYASFCVRRGTGRLS